MVLDSGEEGGTVNEPGQHSDSWATASVLVPI